MGSEGCHCYGNNTCDAPLTCLSGLCVNAGGPGSGGASASGGAPGSGGSPATGGTTGNGGATASGGTTGTGGAPSSGGTTGSGGTTSSGGTTGSGGAPSSGGTTGSGGTPSSGGTTGSGGAPSSGGTTGSGGTPSSGGTTGSGGSAPTGPLHFTGGWVDGTSNAYAIQGAIYTFDDGAGSTISPDCSTGAACFGGTTTPTTKFCVSGTDTTILYSTALNDYDYSTYWGAAVGFDLNGSAVTGGTHAPYVASAHNVVGFSMTFTNSAASSVRFSYIVYNGISNTQYCVKQLSPGQNAIYFTNANATCYNTPAGAALTNVAADGTVALQWQVPSSISGAVPFNFCIDNLTPLTQ
jgi:hypothetical protein